MQAAKMDGMTAPQVPELKRRHGDHFCAQLHERPAQARQVSRLSEDDQVRAPAKLRCAV